MRLRRWEVWGESDRRWPHPCSRHLTRGGAQRQAELLEEISARRYLAGLTVRPLHYWVRNTDPTRG